MLERTDGAGQGVERGGSTALRDALRRARAEAAEHTDVVTDLRHAEIARLELLHEELEPVFAQTPAEIDMFDLGLAAGERPRLFVDMVSFVEMGRDKRTYRFLRDGRHGRSVIAESALTEPIVEAVTAYVARRLIERERLLADDDRIARLETEGAGAAAQEPPARLPPPAAAATPGAVHAAPASEATAPGTAHPPAPRRRGGWVRLLTILAAFVVGGAIGAAVVMVMIAAIAKGYLPV